MLSLLAVEIAFSEVATRDAAKLEGAEGIAAVRASRIDYTSIAMNVEKPVLSNVRIRQALRRPCVLSASEQEMVVAQAMGGAGFMADSAVARLFRDAKLIKIGAGTSEFRRMLIGREMMGAVS